MNQPSKTGGIQFEPARDSAQYKVAVVGAGSLKGKDLAEVLNERNFPSSQVKLLDDDESLGQLEAVGDEVTFIQKLRLEEFRNVDFTFFASDPQSTLKTWKAVRETGSAIVDMSYALEDDPDAVVRAPSVERQLELRLFPELEPKATVIAHPAAVVLATLMLKVQKAGAVRHVAATVFEPASEHGQKGMDELHNQTISLFSFQPLPKDIFGTQVAFNLISRYGEQSVPALSSVQSRILKHYRKIVPEAPVPSLLLLQAPVFHGYAFAIQVELEQTADVEKIAGVLTGDRVNVTHSPDDSPSNVSAAGQGDIQVSIVPDESNPRGLWLWAASDNLRIAATTAVECAETLIATRPRGVVQ
jgi:aspartate-semialdehyde dehydrogenase